VLERADRRHPSFGAISVPDPSELAPPAEGSRSRALHGGSVTPNRRATILHKRSATSGDLLPGLVDLWTERKPTPEAERPPDRGYRLGWIVSSPVERSVMA